MKISLKIFLTGFVGALALGVTGIAWAQSVAFEPRSPVAVQTFFELNSKSADVWTEARLSSLIQEIEHSHTHGLQPDDYHLQDLKRAQPGQHRDLVATDAFLTLAGHYLSGKVSPVELEPSWTASTRKADLAAFLDTTIRSNTDVGEALRSLLPQQDGYARLHAALAHLRTIAPNALAPNTQTLKPGMAHPDVLVLRQKLELLGFVVENRLSDVYDDALRSQVLAFQTRFGLDADGVVGPDTRRQLNQPLSHWVEQLIVNLERWRWLPNTLGDRYVWVNIPEFVANYVESGDTRLSQNIIVGRTYRKTPVFSAKMTYLILNPWWEVPSSIFIKDKLPTFKTDITQAEQDGFILVNQANQSVSLSQIDWKKDAAISGYRLRQRPGPKNALGQVKFMFPNKHDVYMHDTNARELFSATKRDMSSGCVRLSQPLDLAYLVLAPNEDWPQERVQDVLSRSDRDTRVDLKRPVDVHLQYLTVVFDGAGNIRFLQDVYERDASVLEALRKS